MSRPTITFHNIETDEYISREMNDLEFADYQETQKIYEAEQQAEADKAQAKVALLERLGITAEEATILLS